MRRHADPELKLSHVRHKLNAFEQQAEAAAEHEMKLIEMEYRQKMLRERQEFQGACCNDSSYDRFSSVATYLHRTNAAMKEELL